MIAQSIAAIRDGLASLRQLDPQLRVFGARDHRYQLASPLDAGALAEAEARFGAPLPDGYRAFITQLGDGGAGPYWGLHPLATGIGRLFEMFDQDAVLAADFPFDDDVDFAALVGQPADEAAWENLKDRTYVPANYAGTLPLCDFGSGEYYFMVVRGAHPGRIWVNGVDNGTGLFSLRVDFLEFYARWLADARARARADDFKSRNTRWLSLEYGDNPRYRRGM